MANIFPPMEKTRLSSHLMSSVAWGSARQKVRMASMFMTGPRSASQPGSAATAGRKGGTGGQRLRVEHLSEPGRADRHPGLPETGDPERPAPRNADRERGRRA